MKNLVIVESPTKARTISKFLGNEYDIKFSMGHIMDLPKSKLGIDVANNFAPQYEVIADKKKLISELKAAAKTADIIILATDPDREGEAISANIQELLTEGKSKITKDKFRRIVFHEITEDAVKAALTHPREVDTHLVNAQIARRVLDRLVGYQISPVLWKKVRRGLSAGRVQSVALRLLVEREREIVSFAKQKYWTMHTMLRKTSAVIASKARQSHKDGIASSSTTPRNDSKGTEFELIEINKKRIESKETFSLYDGDYTTTKTIVDAQKRADEIVADLKVDTYVVADVNQRQMKRSPYAPFTTSTLQQDASRRYGFSGKRTMSLAQKLYEEGFITYHRTDSVTLSPQAITQMREYLVKEYGAKYISEKPRIYSAKQKLAQEAHEGIRPTKVAVDVVVVASQVGADYAKLYDLIWRRAVASQMSDAIIESTTVYVDASLVIASEARPVPERVQSHKDGIASSSTTPRNDEYKLKASGSVLVFDGFLKLNPQALKDTVLPGFTAGEALDLQSARADEHETLPPPRYNDASLIGTLEEKGIGRPSTYASIISTIIDRGYVERVEKRFEPTPVGIAVTDFLVKNFATIDDVPFTAAMEDELDGIASGQKDWTAMMKEFYVPFEKKIAEVQDAERVKIATEETGEACPMCNEPVVVRFGKFGKFLSCSTFPDCKFTKPFVEETNILCPKDDGRVIVKKTRKGRKFYGCSNYPNCDFAAWKLEDIKTGVAGLPQKKTTTTGIKKTTAVKKALTKRAVKAT